MRSAIRRAAMLGATGAIVVGIVGVVRCGRSHTTSHTAIHEETSARPTTPAMVSSPTLPPSPDSTPARPAPVTQTDLIGSAPAYPVNLDALRARLPGNRYWELAAPTSDPEVAKQRARRAERDNVAFGRIQANEASAEEIHAYYAERRAISRDFLELSELVLEEQGDALPERDRGMFALSANLHRARLTQIDRDESDALNRIGAR